MSDPHFTRDHVWVVFTDDAFSVPTAAVKALGIDGIYFNAAAAGTPARIAPTRAAGFKVGIFYPASSAGNGADVAKAVNAYRLKVFNNDGGQTPILLDFEPSAGGAQFWLDFIAVYRGLLPGRVTDFTPEPFKGADLPVQALLDARFDAKVQHYFGDMSPVDAGEARDDLVAWGFPRERVRGFVDGGRVIKPPIFYQGRKVRNLQPGTCVWSANLLREAGLI